MIVVGLWNMTRKRREGFVTVQGDVLYGVSELCGVAGANY